MDSLKLLDDIIIHQQNKDNQYPVKEHVLIQLCIRLNKNIQGKIDNLMAKHGVNDSMFMIVMLLSTSDNYCLSPSDISNLLSYSKTNVTRISDSLVKKGFIRRIDNGGDRRRKLIYLTPEGELFLQYITRVMIFYLRNIWSSLSDDELLEFETINKKLSSHLERM